MADIWRWFLLIVGLLIVFVSCWVAVEALFPSLVARAREQYARPGRITLVGLAIIVPIVLLAIAAAKRNNPVFALLAASLIGVIIAVGLAGSSGLSQRIGAGLPSPVDEEQPWRRVLRGGIVLSLTFLLPVFGWFFLLPWALVSGFGAIVMAVTQGNKENKQAAPAVVAAKQTV